MDEPARPLLQRIVEGGPIIMLLYFLIAGAVVTVACVRIHRSHRGGYAPATLPLFLAFAPLLLASFGAFLCFFSIHSGLTSVYGLTGPEGAIRAVGGGYLILCTGWLSTALALLIAYVPSRTKVA